jgi:hypothetical protein
VATARDAGDERADTNSRQGRETDQTLSSDRDGEVLAAVHALKRTLDSAKLDIHALANAIEGAKAPTRNNKFPEPSWHEIACGCAARRSLLRDYEKNFVEDMVRRTAAHGASTEKQARWLRSIYVRVMRP